MDNGPARGRHLKTQDFFLPDFCQIRPVFGVVITGELLAFVLTLAQPGAGGWGTLSLVSLYVQWVALPSAALLCVLRPWLARFRDGTAGTLAHGVVMIVTVSVSEGGFRLIYDPLRDTSHAGFLLRSLAISAIVTAVMLRYLYMQHSWREKLKMESESRIEALQARIRPHFLFNSLNTIVSMVRSQPEAAERAVEDLADLFRASLDQGSRLVSYDRECELARGYLRMEDLRLGDRLSVEWATEELPDDALLPPLTLQPLLENAVYHGIEPRVDGGWLRVSGARQDDELVLEIGNSRPPEGTGRRRSGIGMAQENVRERLALAFGDDGRFEIEQTQEEYRVRLRFPYRKGGG